MVKSGRTHLMDATPVRLGQEFGGYASQLDHGIRRRAAGLRGARRAGAGRHRGGHGHQPAPDFPGQAIAQIYELTGLEFREADDHFEAQGAKDATSSPRGR